MPLGILLSRHARYKPDRLAVVHGAHRLSFQAFNARVNRLANALLAAGLRKGDNVACVLQNGLEILELYWAAAKSGTVIVPLSPLLGREAIIALVKHADARMLFMGADHETDLAAIAGSLSLPSGRFVTVGCRSTLYPTFEALVANASDAEPPDPQCSEDDPLTIFYSSGTTGEPKGIVLSHYARGMYCTLYASAWRMTPESVSLHAGSLVFNGSLMTLLPSFFLGGTYILHREFRPADVIETIARERVTHMVMVPSQIAALLNHPELDAGKLASLQALISLGEILHLAQKERLCALLPDRFYEMYGLAEGFMTILDKSDAPRKLASVGVPPPFFEMRILDEHGAEQPVNTVGEIAGRGPILMKGYYGRPDLTEKAIVDGWLRSGDLGYVDPDGYLFLVDRKKELIKSGGVSVYPRDIEEVISQHPQVKDVAVFGVPHERWGETPVAAVVLSEAAHVEADELKSWINSRVSARYQRIFAIKVMPSFPRNAAGKTLKRVIRDDYLRGMAASTK